MISRGSWPRPASVEILLVGTGTILRPLPADAARRACGSRHFGRPDVDRGGGAHLQRAARRGPGGGGGADRRRLTGRHPDPRHRRRPGRPIADRYVTALYAPAETRARSDGALCLQRRDCRHSRAASAKRCPARCGCNGGAIRSTAGAQGPAVTRPSGGRCAERGHRAHWLPDGGAAELSRCPHLRSLRRSDAVAHRSRRLLRRDGRHDPAACRTGARPGLPRRASPSLAGHAACAQGIAGMLQDAAGARVARASASCRATFWPAAGSSPEAF